MLAIAQQNIFIIIVSLIESVGIKSKQFLTAGTVSFSSSDTVLIWLKSVRLLLHELLLKKRRYYDVIKHFF